jgi:alpha-tubulin suppressor-like RCC1 family protein
MTCASLRRQLVCCSLALGVTACSLPLAPLDRVRPAPPHHDGAGHEPTGSRDGGTHAAHDGGHEPTSVSDAGAMESDAGSSTACFGCSVDGQCHEQGEAHPSDPCLVCDVARAADAWSPNAGHACSAETECAAAGVCSIDGACVVKPLEAGTSCAAGVTACGASACDGNGACVTHHELAGTSCGDAAPCLDAPHCDGQGTCSPALPLARDTTCGAHGTCDGAAAPSCVCEPGYELSALGCVDVDECSRKLDDCDRAPLACANEDGSYACACPEGFVGDGHGITGCRCEHADWSPLCAPWSDVSIKTGHGCALSGGALFCWGANDRGQLGLGDTTDRHAPTRVGEARDWQQVGVGYRHTCGIRAGSLYCWGMSDHGAAGVKSPSYLTLPARVGDDDDWLRVDAGDDYSCGLRAAGEVYCWGSNMYGQNGTQYETDSPTRVGSFAGVEDVRAFANTTCALRQGEVYCWGANGYGQLGDGTTLSNSNPERVGDVSDYVALGVGSEHVCAARTDGSADCWGHNIGYGPHRFVDAGDDPVVDVACGDGFQCVLRASGHAQCRGKAENGRLGTGGTFYVADFSELIPEGGISQLAPGSLASCAIQNGRLLCWGQNTRGAAALPLEPERVGLDSDWLDLSVGTTHSCGIREPGRLYCWGGMQTGNPRPTDVPYFEPARIGSDDDWQNVAAGENYTCGVRKNGLLSCWGTNLVNRLGMDGEAVTVPTRVGAFSDWRTVSAFDQHTCAIRSEQGLLYCWGSNSQNAIGDGLPTAHARPTLVGDPGYTSVSAGPGYTCGVRGDTYCWGTGTSGRSVSSATPRLLPTPRALTFVLTSTEFSAALGSDGSLLGWGSAANGRLGLSTDAVVTPMVLPGAAPFLSLAIGTAHGCAIDASGRLLCWGQNSQGQLATGDSLARGQASPISPESMRFSLVRARLDRTCGISQGALYCWGNNGNGELGHARGLRPWLVENINDRE